MIPSSGVVVPAGPQNALRCRGSVRQANTNGLGPDTVRVYTSSSALMGGAPVAGGHRVVQPVGPDLPSRLDPGHGLLQRRSFQPARPSRSGRPSDPQDGSSALRGEGAAAGGERW